MLRGTQCVKWSEMSEKYMLPLFNLSLERVSSLAWMTSWVTVLFPVSWRGYLQLLAKRQHFVIILYPEDVILIITLTFLNNSLHYLFVDWICLFTVVLNNCYLTFQKLLKISNNFRNVCDFTKRDGFYQYFPRKN